jgi:acyl carrier protein
MVMLRAGNGARQPESIIDRPIPISEMPRISRRLSPSRRAIAGFLRVFHVRRAAGHGLAIRLNQVSEGAAIPGRRRRDRVWSVIFQKFAIRVYLKLEYTGMSVRSTVTTIFEQVAKEQRRTLVPMSDHLKLLESGLDSLSFAIIVAKLEDEMGFDPFNSDEMVEFPITFGDFVRLYETPPR